MYVIKRCKKLKQAWRLYVCPKCGEEAVECKEEAMELFKRINLSDNCREPKVQYTSDYCTSGHHARKCSNCGTKILPTVLDDDKYTSIFLGLPVELEFGNRYVLKENDLFY